MITLTLVFLIILLITAFLVGLNKGMEGLVAISGLFAVLLFLFLIVAVIDLIYKPIEYERFVAERTAFSATLDKARGGEYPLETAAIAQQITEWNVKLAELQYKNTVTWYDEYIDDRIDNLKPIQ